MKDFVSQLYIRRILRYALYLFLALVVQNMLFTGIRPFGVCPMVLPAVCVAVGMFQESAWAISFCVVLGVFADMAYVENTFLFTVLFPALAFFTGFLCHSLLNRRFFSFLWLTLAASLVTASAQMVATGLRDAFSVSMIPTVVIQSLISLVPAPLAYLPPAKWIE